MPTYNYQCKKCGTIFHLFLKMSDNDQPTQEPCPYCMKMGVTQIIVSAPPMADPYSIR